MPGIALTPSKHKNGRKNNNRTFLLTQRSKLAWQHTEQSQTAMQKPFKHMLPQKKTQATERLNKGAPPSAPIDILVSKLNPLTFK
jgi:hypothetical protein